MENTILICRGRLRRMVMRKVLILTGKRRQISCGSNLQALYQDPAREQKVVGNFGPANGSQLGQLAGRIVGLEALDQHVALRLNGEREALGVRGSGVCRKRETILRHSD